MRKVIEIRSRLFIFLFILWPIIGCTHQEIHDSPCATLNATVQIKPSVSLSLMFGNDAIKAAVDAMVGRLAKQGDKSVPSLTSSGKDAALSTAKTNGMNPTTNDIAALETYLNNDVVPTIKQNPTCHFTVVSLGKPYVGVEKVSIESMGDRRIPQVSVKNTGQAEVRCRVVLAQFIAGVEHSSGTADLRLGPNQGRGLFLPEANLPITDIESGKSSFIIAVAISYPLNTGETSASSSEAWQYDHTTRQFILAPLK